MRFIAKAVMLFFGLVTAAGMLQLGLAPNWFAALFVFLLIQLVAIFVHELGHAVAARRRGATLEAFCVLWWEYDFRARTFGAARQLAGGDVGGFVLYSFDEYEPTRQDDAIISAAGPAANILLALVALLAAFLLATVQDRPSASPIAIVEESAGPRPDMPIVNLPSDAEMRAVAARYAARRRREAVTGWLQGLASVLAVLSLGMGLANLVPFRGSDGDRLWRALSRKRSWRQSGGA